MNAAAVRLPPPEHRQLRVLAGVFAVGAILAGVLLAAPAPAAASLPTIISTAWAPTTSEVLLEAKIDPGGLATSYEIQVECPDHIPCQRTEGTLPAVDGGLTVILALSYPQYGSTYWFTVTAHNADGEASKRSEVELPSNPPNIPPGACPFGGCPPQQPYKPPELSWANQSGNEAAERTVREQHAKEQAEQQAKEAAAHQAAEAEARKHAAEAAQAATAAQQQEEAEHSACTVPALKGDTLTTARHALTHAHCRLGKITQPRHHHGTLYITAQAPRPGEQLAEGAPVALTLDAKRASRRGKPTGRDFFTTSA